MDKSRKLRGLSAALLVFAALGLVEISRAAPEDELAGRTITYTGYLEQGGTPVDGDRTFIFQLFDARTGGPRLWPTTDAGGTRNVAVSAGRFVVELGGAEMSSLPESAFSTPELWLQVSVVVGGRAVALGDRQRVGTSRHASNGVPAGTIIAFGADAARAPDGWLPCDGRPLDGRRPEYQSLFRAIDTTWGDGSNDSDPTTNFNVPDLRGRFLRGLDTTEAPEVVRDEDRSERTPAAPGGSSGARVGTLQPDQLRSHAHTVSDVLRDRLVSSGFVGGGSYGQYESISTNSTGGAETRPENAAVAYLVKL